MKALRYGANGNLVDHSVKDVALSEPHLCHSRECVPYTNAFSRQPLPVAGSVPLYHLALSIQYRCFVCRVGVNVEAPR